MRLALIASFAFVSGALAQDAEDSVPNLAEQDIDIAVFAEKLAEAHRRLIEFAERWNLDPPEPIDVQILDIQSGEAIDESDARQNWRPFNFNGHTLYFVPLSK